MKYLIKSLIKFFWPNHCVVCREETKRDGVLCGECELNLPRNKTVCFQCGVNLDSGHQANYCGQCLADPPSFQQTVSFFRYTHPLDQWITQLKFNQKLLYGNLLGKLFAYEMAKSRTPDSFPNILLPMPLHENRLKSRGFNQALEIAKPISKILKIPIDYRSAQRIKNTQAQSLLSASERKENLKKAFAVKNKLPLHVAIIDDVMTTGTSVRELSKILKKSGVERIEVWCLARAELANSK